MKDYDYGDAMINDIDEALTDKSGQYFQKLAEVANEEGENFDLAEYVKSDEFYEFCYDAMWVDDSITGNASGSYTFNTYIAEENLCHNSDLLWDALAEFGSPWADTSNGAEWCDVTIRCYLLGEILRVALDISAEELSKAVAEYL